jgi:hypothetical protein
MTLWEGGTVDKGGAAVDLKISKDVLGRGATSTTEKEHP